MKSFISKLFVFWLGWFLFAVVIDMIVTARAKSSGEHKIFSWEKTISCDNNNDIIILGSSRAENAYNPIVIDSILGTHSYNMGMEGKKCDMDIIRYHVYKKYNKYPPKIIIWDVFHDTFNHSDRYADYQHAPFVFDSIIWHGIHNELHSFSYLDRVIPLLRYYKTARIFDIVLSPRDTNCFHDNGFIRFEFSWDSDYCNKYYRTAKKDLKQMSNFRNAIREMRADGTDVILVYSPLHAIGQPRIELLDSICSFYEEIASEEGCLFLNFLTHPMCNDTQYFWNIEHLNGNGADIFSGILADTLHSLGIIHNSVFN